ncbi:MAG: hypothetical protein JSV12_07290 [Candidatus Bathyarchaeota archaeon]|nr:MAG: hypothetical protein JSV12_07290 [Candidatus Bathyarchaeota archaeon]
MERSTEITLPKSYPYKTLLERARTQLGDSGLLKVLSLDKVDEASHKIELIPLLVNLEWDNLYELGNRLDAPVDEQMNRGDLTRTVLVNSKLMQLMSIFKGLANEEFIVRINYDGRVIGPLGVTVLRPNEDADATIALVLFLKNTKQPLLDAIVNKARLRKSTPVETTQRIVSELGASRTFQILSNMILSQELDVDRLEEDIPWGIRVDKRYGIHYAGETPIEKLSSLLCTEFSEQDLELYLNPELGSYNDRVLAYCIQNNPFDIIESLIGEPFLRRCIIKHHGIKRKLLPSKKQELINLILFHMGFFIPVSPSGLNNYVDILNGLKRTLSRTKKLETIVGSITSGFVETEKVLKDITFFYGAHLIHNEDESLQKRKEDLEDIEKEILRMCYGKEGRVRSIERASFGQLVEILRLMEKHVEQTPQLSKRMDDFFGRQTILDPKGQIIRRLDQISPYRKFYVHDVSKKDLHESKPAIFVLDLMNKLAESLRGIYPTPIFGARLVTDNFGTTYLIAKDEQDKEYTIYMSEYIDDEVLQHQYLMKSSSSLIVLNPILVFKS